MGWWSAPHPGRFTPGKETRYPLYRRLGGPQSRFERVRKILSQPGFNPRTVHPVASRYMVYGIPAHNSIAELKKNSVLVRLAP
jgi:hypothetical protein